MRTLSLPLCTFATLKTTPHPANPEHLRRHMSGHGRETMSAACVSRQNVDPDWDLMRAHRPALPDWSCIADGQTPAASSTRSR
jgi:hypothetical protein